MEAEEQVESKKTNQVIRDVGDCLNWREGVEGAHQGR